MTLIAEELSEAVVGLCRANGFRLATVESCTGGLVAASITDIAGSSDIFECGFVTYSNDAKSTMVGVDRELIDSEGAVSKRVALAMASGALTHSNATIAVSTTGIAGPGGGTNLKPVGLVHLAVASISHETDHLKPISVKHRAM